MKPGARWISLTFSMLAGIGLGTTAAAQDERAMRFERGALVSPAAAATYYGAGLTRSSSFSGVTGFEGRPPEIVEQAKALNNDPDLIFEYVRNHIEPEFAFGLRKGALGTLVDKSGTPFDQNVLFVELVRQAGYTARYRIGTATLTFAQFTEWTGVSNLAAACRMLAFGGIPASFNGAASSDAGCALTGSLNSANLRHIWSEVYIGGVWYAFDPSFKVQAVAPRRDLEAGSGLTPGAVVAQAETGLEAGSEAGVPYIRNINDTNTDAYLAARSSQLLTDVSVNAPSADMREVVGGKEVVAAYAPAGGFRSVSPPYAVADVVSVSGDIPDQYRTGFAISATVSFGAINRQLWVDEVYGRRLELDSAFYADRIQKPGDYFDTEFRLELDDVALNVVSSTCPADTYQPGCVLPGWTYSGTITVNHPYAAVGGTYADAVFNIDGGGSISTAILHGWGRVSPDLGAIWGQERDEDRAMPNRVGAGYICDPEWLCQPEFETPSGDVNRQRIGAAWLAQMSRMLELQGEIGATEIQHHHSVGTVQWGYAMTTYDPYPGIDGPLDFGVVDQQLIVNAGTSLSVSSRTDDAVRTRAVSRAVALAAATLEGSVVEQMQDLPDGASTASRLAWGNRPDTEDPCVNGARRRFYDFSGASSATRAGLLLYEGTASGCTTMPGIRPIDRNEVKNGYNFLIGQLVSQGYAVSGSAESFLGPGSRWGSDAIYDTSFRSPSVQRGGAIVGNLFDANGEVLSVAHLIQTRYGPSKGGGGSPPERSATTFDAKKAADILKDRFIDRSAALGVNLKTGTVGYSSPILLSSGAGEGAPYRLDYNLSYQSGPQTCSGRYGPCSGPRQAGWTHNWDIQFSLSGSGLEAMGATSPLAATDTITAFMALQDIFAQGGVANMRKDIYAAIVADWWRRRMVANVATINRAFQAQQYVRQANNTWMAPIGSPGALVQTGTRSKVRDVCAPNATGASRSISTARRWDQAGVNFSLRQANGETMSFAPWSYTYSTDQCAKLYGFRLTSWTWPEGPSLAFGGTHGVVTSVTSSLGRTMNFGGGASIDGRNAGPLPFSSFADSAGAVWRYAYTGGTARTATQRPRPSRLYQLFEPTQPTRPALEFTYDALGRVSEARDATALQWQLRGANQFRIAEGVRGERIDPAGGRYVVYYDVDGDPVRNIDEIDRETTSIFDGRHRVASRTYPEGDQDQFAYDGRDNVVRLARKAKPGSTLADIAVEAAWNPTWNKPDWVEDALDRRTTFAYYASGAGAGLLREARQPAVVEGQPVWSFQYNANGLVTRETDPTGRVSTHVYDGLGNRSSSTAAVTAIGGPALNLLTTFTPSAWGDVVATVDPRGNATTTQFDAMRRPTAEQRRNGGAAAIPLTRTERAYDGLGRVVLERGASALDSSGNATAWAATTTAYTPTGKTWRTTDPDGRMTTMTYDALDRQATTISAEGDVTALAYDMVGQTLTETRAWTSKDQITYAAYAYTPNGQRSWIQDANANRTAYAYDGFDRLTQTTFPNPTNGQPNAADYEALTYDPVGSVLTRRTRRNVTLTSTYDALNRVSTKLVPAHGSIPARTTTFGYDLAGRPTSLTDTAGHTLTYTHDAAARLLSTQTSGPQWSGAKTVGYQYDAAGNRTRVTWPDSWYVQYGFDAANRMTTASQDGSFTLATFGWDPLSKRNAITYPGGASMAAVHTAAGDQTARSFAWSGGNLAYANTFDFAHRLTSQTLSNPAFQWSPPGAETTYAPDRLNRYASVGGVAQSYDANGNLTGDGAWAYVYDAENRLLSANRSGVSATYQYDPLGRRAGRTVGSVTNAWLTDGDDEIAEYDGAGALLRRFVQGPMIDQPIAQVEANGTRRYLMQDRMGSIVGATSDVGVLAEGPYAYDPYGLPDTTSGVPYRYTGRRFDAETGLYYYRARYYSPTLGRFLQTDPVGYADNLNMYGYVANDPVNRTDPTGRVAMATCPWCEESGEMRGVETLPISDQIIAQAYDGNSEGSVQNPFAGADIDPGYATAYAFANVSAAVAVGGEAKLGGYAVTNLMSGEVIEQGFVVGGLAGFGADAAIGGGVQVSPGRPTDGVTFAAQGSIGAVSFDSQGAVGINVSPIPLPASGIAGIQVQKHIPTYKSKNWTEPY